MDAIEYGRARNLADAAAFNVERIDLNELPETERATAEAQVEQVKLGRTSCAGDKAATDAKDAGKDAKANQDDKAAAESGALAAKGSERVKDECRNGDCMTELTYPLASVFLARQLVATGKQVVLPYLLRRWQRIAYSLRLRRVRKDVQKGKLEDLPAEMSPAERQSLLKPHDGVIEEYVDVIITFGFFSMFAAAFPISGLVALVSNLFEIRIDAFKFCNLMQRPRYHGAKTIGIFYPILQFVGLAAVITNSLIIGVVSDQLNTVYELDETSRIWAIVAAEHLILLAKIIIMWAIPDIPEGVRKGIAIQRFHQRILLDHADGSDVVRGEWTVDTETVQDL